MSKTSQRHLSYFQLGKEDNKEGKPKRKVPRGFRQDFNRGYIYVEEDI